MMNEQDQAILEEFTASGERFEQLVSDLGEQQLDWMAAPGEWSIRQTVHHLAEDGDVWSMLVKKAIATPGVPARFEGFPGNDIWARELSTDKREIGPALALIHAHRTFLAHLAADFPHAWDRQVIIHDETGRAVQPLSVREILDMLSDHMREHIRVVESTLTASEAVQSTP